MKTAGKPPIRSHLPIIADFVDGQEDAVQVFQKHLLLDVFPEHVVDGVIEAVQHTHQDQLQTVNI